MQRRSDSLKFLEVYDPDTGREGTDVVGFFSRFKDRRNLPSG